VIWSAARTSAGLSLLFLAVYGSCNWFTSLRTDVGTWYFEWERRIPFVALMILPYMSIDLQAATAFIAQHAKTGIVYVHCKVGYSRSAAVVGAHLLATGQAATVADAELRLRQARPSIVIRGEAMAALHRFALAPR